MRLRAVDLFAGCGGLSLGLRRAGFEIILANEMDKFAADTYGSNHPDTEILCGDIHDFSPRICELRGEVDLLVGGPPCQGFSVTGRRQYGEIPAQNTLVESFLDVVLQVRPRLVLMENVAGFRTAQLKPGVKALPFVLERLHALGYSPAVKVLQAAEFGVPSLRSRLFVIAKIDGLSTDPFPNATHSSRDGSKAPYIGCLAAISDLPPIAAGEGVEELVPYFGAPRNEYQVELRHGSAGVANHVAMRHTPALVDRFATIAPGSSSYLLPDTKVTVYKSNNQRLLGALPSLCITANFQSNYIHPVLHRNLTTREAARLMTYPDAFLFKGKRTLMSKKFLEKYGRTAEIGLSQYNQIGNSVPPRLAEAIGRSVAQLLDYKSSKKARAA